MIRQTASFAGLVMAAASALPAQQAASPAQREFSVASRDGTEIHGEADLPAGSPKVAIVMVAGTGLFDRDVRFGKSGTDRDKLFKDLADRFVRQGLVAVRYDRRGVRFGKTGADRLDAAVSATSTVDTQREDLDAVYRWATSTAKDGLGARCVILFGHSEGTQHIARLAESGAPAPLAVMAIGAVTGSPEETLRWQMRERDAVSLEQMDVDHDGLTTLQEVVAHWRETPSSLLDNVTPLLPADGKAWTAERIGKVRNVQAALYQTAKAAALALDDAAPYPNGATPMARNSWWKSWFTDETPMAKRLAAWNVPMILHWGSNDSQTPPSITAPPARQYLGARATIVVHPGLGHSLGNHPLLAPADPIVADQIAGEAADLARRCR